MMEIFTAIAFAIVAFSLFFSGFVLGFIMAEKFWYIRVNGKLTDYAIDMRVKALNSKRSSHER